MLTKLEVEHVEDGSVQIDASAGFDAVTERQLTKSLLRKLDTRMLPMLAILFLFSFLDRTNIGNAKVGRITGLNSPPDSRTPNRPQTRCCPILGVFGHILRLLHCIRGAIKSVNQKDLAQNMARCLDDCVGSDWNGHGFRKRLHRLISRASLSRHF